jgi:hypothetical protein
MASTPLAEHRLAFRRAVARATLAPSVHNTQPWRFLLRPAGLEILADRGRQLAVLDRTGRQLHLSVGCALFNARVSLAASGYGAKVIRLPDDTRPELMARIEITGGEAVDPDLAALDSLIELRQTNRRHFADEQTPEDLVVQLVKAAAAEGAVLHPVVDPADRRAVARLSQSADLQQITDPAYRAELRAWTSNDPDRRDGVPARVVPHIDGSAGDEVPIRDFDSQGAGWLPAQTRSTADQCLLLLGSIEENPSSWLRAGEALERIWLHLTRAGYVASVFTQVIEVAASRAQLRDELRLNTHPHVLLRVGRAPATASTPRRRIADVFDDLTDR